MKHAIQHPFAIKLVSCCTPSFAKTFFSMTSKIRNSAFLFHGSHNLPTFTTRVQKHLSFHLSLDHFLLLPWIMEDSFKIHRDCLFLVHLFSHSIALKKIHYLSQTIFGARVYTVYKKLTYKNIIIK